MTPDTLTPSQWEQLCSTIAAALGLDPTLVQPESSRSSLPEWDSIKHMEIILELERGFGIRFTSTEWIGCLEIADIAKAIQAHLEKISSRLPT